ncbi:hypothetical protein MBOT_21710 [Mycobacterium botniense]|uniref:Uncharacterized protein n=1 Tax=Mycobacterium botniense TaxID=84962 RepID=A0A7I9XYC7_9MYCO|nr:hypothetical protein MBOT_21710 [Mycobacterium botniense]
MSPRRPQAQVARFRFAPTTSKAYRLHARSTSLPSRPRKRIACTAARRITVMLGFGLGRNVIGAYFSQRRQLKEQAA